MFGENVNKKPNSIGKSQNWRMNPLALNLFEFLEVSSIRAKMVTQSTGVHGCL